MHNAIPLLSVAKQPHHHAHSPKQRIQIRPTYTGGRLLPHTGMGRP